METLTALTQYYASHDENGRLLPRHGQVEYLTTMRYIHRYLRPAMKVLEIGAGTGRYAHALAREGYEVTAVELIQGNLDQLIAATRPGENIHPMLGDATDLSFLDSGAFDMVLVLGPMYHLFSLENRKQALTEALRVARRGGFLMTAYCLADVSILRHGFMDGHIFELIEKGLIDTDAFVARSTPAEVFQLHRKEDIDALMYGLPAKRLHYVATDLYTNHMRDAVDQMDDRMFEIYFKYHTFACEREDLVGISHHSLDIVRKE